jgi:hypothetical protein
MNTDIDPIDTAQDVDSNPNSAADPIIDELDLEKFAAGQRALARRRTIGAYVALLVAAIVVPLLFLRATGRLSTAQFHQPALRNGTAAPGATTLGHGQQLGAFAKSVSSPEQLQHDKVIAADLRNYLTNGIERLSPREQVATDAYNSATGKNFKSRAESFRIMREVVVPKYGAFVVAASQLKPKTPEVQALNNLFITSIQLRMLGYEHIAQGEHAKDNAWRLTAGAELAASDKAAEQFQAATLNEAQVQAVPLPKF